MTPRSLRDELADAIRQAVRVRPGHNTLNALHTGAITDFHLSGREAETAADAVLDRRDLLARTMVEIDAMYRQWREHAAAELEDAAVVILQNRPTIPVSDDTRQKFALAERSTRNRIACHLRDRARELRGGPDHDGSGT